MKYAIVIEKAERNYSAYVPDLPGCIATGRTPAETRKNIAEAVEFHIEGMLEDGLEIPKATAAVGTIPVETPKRRIVRKRTVRARSAKFHAAN